MTNSPDDSENMQTRIRELLSEVDRLSAELAEVRAEVERQRAEKIDERMRMHDALEGRDAELRVATNGAIRIGQERDAARAEIEKLRDELERLTKHTAVVMACRDVAAAEIDHLRAKISEAHAALWGMYCAAGNLKDDVRQFERIAEDCIARAEYIEAGPMVPTPSQDEAENIKTALLDILHGRQRPGPWLYDRVKEERDRLRSLVAECRPVVELVGALQARHAKQEDHINEVMALIEAKLPAMEGGE